MSDAVERYEVCLVSETDWIGAGEICALCRLDLTAIAELAELGVVTPRGTAPAEWLLPAAALPRLALAGRLMRDLGVNVSGAALAVELLESQQTLERQLKRLEQLLAP